MDYPPPTGSPSRFSSPEDLPPPPVAGTNGKATAALVLGICGLAVCPLICSILALVFGYQGRSEIDRGGRMEGGRGLAVSGIVLGWIGVVLVTLFIILIVVIAATGELDDDYYYE